MNDARPIAFLVATPGGQPAREVLDALRPALERLGSIRLIDYPESSLTHAAACAEEQGQRAVQLAIGPLHACYLTPAVPTIIVPLWDYPQIPTTEMDCNSRLNWARIANRADLILAPSKFTAEAFLAAGITTRVEIVPLPACAGWSDLPTWGPGLPTTVNVPHVVWTGATSDAETGESISPEVTGEPRQRWSERLARAGRARLRRFKPYFSNETTQKIDGVVRRASPILRANPIQLLAKLPKASFRRFVSPWISHKAHIRIKGVMRVGNKGAVAIEPKVLPASPLTLSGLVYTSIVDYDDPMTDDVSLVTAAIHAFRDRPDVTILLLLPSSPKREAIDLNRLEHACLIPRIRHACRIVVVTGRLTDADRLALGRATSYTIETSRSRGWSMRMSESLASGRPMIAPAHSVFADWIDENVGLPVNSHPEPAPWPMEALGRHATTWRRVVWSDLRDRLIESAAIADHDPRRYETLSAASRRTLNDRTAVDVAAERLGAALEHLPCRPAGAFAWA